MSADKLDKEAEAFFKHYKAYNPPEPGAAAATGHHHNKDKGTDTALIRAADALWQTITSNALGLVVGQGLNQIEIGRINLSDTEKWKLHAQLRREEMKTVGSGQYNKKLRATKHTKGPTPGEGFPAGRGKPTR